MIYLLLLLLQQLLLPVVIVSRLFEPTHHNNLLNPPPLPPSSLPSVRVKQLREQVRGLGKEYNKTEDDLKALQSVGQIIGEVLKQLDDERFIVKVNK